VGLRRRRSDTHVIQWDVFPRHEPGAYQLTFTLPDRVEEWIDDSGQSRRRARLTEENLLSSIVLYHLQAGVIAVYQLEYSVAELRQR